MEGTPRFAFFSLQRLRKVKTINACLSIISRSGCVLFREAQNGGTATATGRNETKFSFARGRGGGRGLRHGTKAHQTQKAREIT